MSVPTVERDRRRFVEEGTESAWGRKPQGRKASTMQLLADKLVELELVRTISDETVRRSLKKPTVDPPPADVVHPPPGGRRRVRVGDG